MTARPSILPDTPTLIYANHPSWWDGYMAFVLSDIVWRCESYLMMEEPQLERYGFFRKGRAIYQKRPGKKSKLIRRL